MVGEVGSFVTKSGCSDGNGEFSTGGRVRTGVLVVAKGQPLTPYRTGEDSLSSGDGKVETSLDSGINSIV